ncbi:O-antigen ligase family protein [Alphaproteobacteria bacterium]|nr:O-antigen ligase family protein [Alphaproteobacteria bacterium]
MIALSTKKDIYVFSLFFLLLPFAILTGPAIPDVILSFIALYFLIKSIQLKLFYVYKSLIIKLSIFFSLYLILSSLISSDPIYSLFEYGVIFYFRYLFYVLGVIYLFKNNKSLIDNFGKYSLFIVFFLIIDTNIQLIFGKNIFNFEIEYFGRLSSIFRDELIIGIFLASFCPMVLGLTLKKYNLNINNKYIILFILISFSTILISGERAATLHYIIFIFIIFALSKSVSFKKLFIVLITICSVFALLISFSESVNKRFTETLSDYSETQFKLPFTNIHEGHIKSGIKMFYDKPLFGHGPKMFRKLCDNQDYYHKHSCSSHPHNYYIQLLAETGLVGIFFLILTFFSILIYFIRNLISKINKDLDNVDSDFNIILMASLFSIIWPIAPTFDFFNNWYNVILFTNISLILLSFNKIVFNK